jgi:hypothetical protein
LGDLEDWKGGRMEDFTTEAQRTHRRRNGKNGRVEDGEIRQFDNSTMEELKNGMMEGWNVEALAEIPLRREWKMGMIESYFCYKQAAAPRNVCSY